MSVEIRGAREEERQAAAHVVDLAFDRESYGPSLQNPCQCVGHSDMDSHDRADSMRILTVDGQIVSVAHVAERHAYARGQTVPFGFIAMIATHPDHRRKGYARRVLLDAQDYMRRRGFCYAVMLGASRYYCGSLGWRWHAENQKTLPQKQVLASCSRGEGECRARRACVEDIPFLSRVYQSRYADQFGPVVRSDEYWRRWSLVCDWEGTYIVVLRGREPIGYFHVSPANDRVDEIGWPDHREDHGHQVVLAALCWAGDRGVSDVSFHLSVDDRATMELLRGTGLPVRPTYSRPNGQSTDLPDLTPFLPENCPDGTGLLVKYLQPGPGLLEDVRSDDDLTTAMAQRSWVWFDGDTMGWCSGCTYRNGLGYAASRSLL